MSFHNLSRAGLLVVLVAISAQAAQQDITVSTPVTPGVCPVNTPINYKGNPGVTVAATDQPIAVIGAGSQVQWSFDLADGMCSLTTPTKVTCGAGTLALTIPSGTVNETATATLAGTPSAADLTRTGSITLNVTATNGKCATRNYPISVVSPAMGGGWGDPHMTTVDGIKYDFQGAGEFTALKEDKFEVQARQRPVPTTTVPGPSVYTGLGVCVATYSAVAMRIGSNRVTLEPNVSGQPDPSSLQLRVNGKLETLTDRGIDLRAGGGSDPKAALEGRIVKAFGGAYEFDDAQGTQLVATPAWWDAQKTWYMNLAVYQTTAHKGIWGSLAIDLTNPTHETKSWLPALPDGTSMGLKPDGLNQRYQDLYVTFANAWRVTDATSLFDYAPGTNTGTFTVLDWPRPNTGEVQSCLIPGQTPAPPATQPVAEQACTGVTDPGQKANCTFDVMVTGNTGFGDTYRTMQGFRPHGGGFQPILAGAGTPPPPATKWPWWWWILILILLLIVIVVLIARKKKMP